MKIKMIGTGANYTKYNSASALIDEEMMVDMPNGTLKQLLKMGYQPENIKTIVITHMHGDHIGDIPFFLKYLYCIKERKDTLTIVGPKGIKEQMIKLFQAYRFEDREEIESKMPIQFVELGEEREEVKIKSYTIEAHSVIHGEEKPAYGYIINQALGYTGDSGMCDGVKNICKGSKIVIADSSLLKGDDSHMGIDNIEKLTQDYSIQLIPTHLRDETREEYRKKEITNVKMVEDEYEFEI